MERLTGYNSFGGPYGIGMRCGDNTDTIHAIIKRLASYEDTGLEPEDIKAMYSRIEKIGLPLWKLEELAQAEKEERLVVLPCKPGDIVYRICGPKGRKYIAERLVSAVELCGNSSWRITTTSFDWLGKTVFLTRPEAETALAASGKEVRYE